MYSVRDNDSVIRRHEPEVSLLIVTNGLSSTPPTLLLQQPPVGRGFLIIQASRSHSVIPEPAGLLWMSDQLISETSLTIHNNHKRQISLPGRNSIPALTTSERPQTHALKPLGHWDRPHSSIQLQYLTRQYQHIPLSYQIRIQKAQAATDSTVTGQRNLRATQQ